jgi:hypothetical protein
MVATLVSNPNVPLAGNLGPKLLVPQKYAAKLEAS